MPAPAAADPWANYTPHTKAIVWFKSGPGTAGRTFKAREHYFNRPVREPRQYGIDGLKKMIDKWVGLVATAVVYDLHTGEEVMKFTDTNGWAN